jgi:hypothetical protein
MPGRQHGWALLAAIGCAACTPGGTARGDSDAVKLPEEQAIARAAEMLEARPPASPTETPAATATPEISQR